MLIADLKDKNIAIWGLGNEGKACVDFLQKHKLGRSIKIFETDNEVDLSGIEVIIKSPGVSIYKDELLKAKVAGIQVTSSSDLFFSEMRANRPNVKVVAITGSKGKSTSVSILYHILQKMGKKVVLGGNIGKAMIELIDEDFDIAITEVSSYQAADLSASPQIVMFTNLFFVHTEWHHGHEQYCKDKIHLIANQKQGDVFYINARNEQLEFYCQDFNQGKKYYNQNENFYVEGKVLYYKNEPILSIDELKISGNHNMDNLAGVFSIIKELGFDIKEAAEFAKSFEPLPHRLQKVTTKNAILFINDSISTAPEAAIGAMQSFEGNVAIISGGLENDQDYSDYAKFIENNPKVRVAVTVFQCGPKIADTIRKNVTRDDFVLIEAKSMQEAVEKAYEEMKKFGAGTILLSPTSPSFGVYKNFMERGQDFIDNVNKLT